MNYNKSFLFFLLIAVLFLSPLWAQEFAYPSNYLLSREMVQNKDYLNTEIDADIDCFNYFFNEKAVFKNVVFKNSVLPELEFKREFKVKRNFFDILKTKLTVDEIFNFSGIFTQLNTPQKLLSVFSQGYLFENDLSIYTKMDDRMKKDKFWQDYGTAITTFGDTGTALLIGGILSLNGASRERQVAQMIAEACIDMRCQFLKRFIGKTRPSDVVSSLGPNLVYDSFPSGHTDSAFALATILGEAYSIKWFTYPAALLVGLSRIQQNTHWPSDILAGALLGHLTARKVMFDHGYIPSSDISESEMWKNTRVDIFTDYDVFFDSNQNLNDTSPLMDRIGGLILKSQVAQRISPKSLFQVSYHYRGQVPLILTYNSAQDVFVLPRFSYKINSKTIIFVEYNDDRIKYNDLGIAPYNRTSFPVDYSTEFRIRKTSGGLFLKLADNLYLKPSYSKFNSDYADFTYLNSRGGEGAIELGLVPTGIGPTSALLSYKEGYENPITPFYSQKNKEVYFEVRQKFSISDSAALSFLNESRNFPNYNIGGSSGSGSWIVYGVEYRKSFSSSWNIEAGYYRRSLSSNIPTWNYYKNIYNIELNARF